MPWAAAPAQVRLPPQTLRLTTVGRQESVENPLGKRTTTTYDDAGRQVTPKDANGKVTTTAYDNGRRVDHHRLRCRRPPFAPLPGTTRARAA